MHVTPPQTNISGTIPYQVQTNASSFEGSAWYFLVGEFGFWNYTFLI